MNKYFAAASILLVALLSGCVAQESHRIVEGDKVDTYRSPYSGPKATLVVGIFENRSSYLRGLFSPDSDQLGNQAKTVLKAHLQQTNRFKLVDRENLEGISREAGLLGRTQKITGARYAVTGAVTEFGRKEAGDRQFFGVFGSGRSQIAYSKVTINIVDVLSSEIIYSTQGAGEYSLSDREVLGFGSTSGYDSTLNGKVLNLAMTEAVNSFVRDLERGLFNLE